MRTRMHQRWILAGVLLTSGLWTARPCLAGRRHSSNLPAAAAAAIGKKFPGARIRDVEIERKTRDFVVYEAEIRYRGRELDVQVSDTGVLVRTKEHIPARRLPAAVTRALRELAGADVRGRECELVRTLARARDGRFQTLTTPETSYEIAFHSPHNGRKREVCIAPTGKLLGAPDTEDREENDDENGQDDGD